MKLSDIFYFETNGAREWGGKESLKREMLAWEYRFKRNAARAAFYYTCIGFVVLAALGMIK